MELCRSISSTRLAGGPERLLCRLSTHRIPLDITVRHRRYESGVGWMDVVF
jgi:hypothetical protein